MKQSYSHNGIRQPDSENGEEVGFADKKLSTGNQLPSCFRGGCAIER
jgi:hypothetical protein